MKVLAEWGFERRGNLLLARFARANRRRAA